MIKELVSFLWHRVVLFFYKEQPTCSMNVELHEIIAVWCTALNIVILILGITNKMQRYTIFFITVNALHISGGFSAHHQELKTVHTALGISSLLAATASGARSHERQTVILVWFQELIFSSLGCCKFLFVFLAAFCIFYKWLL